jgi:hypothetical protein
MSLMQEFRKIDEAYRVRMHLPVIRQFSDAELAECIPAIERAESDLYGKTLIPFNARVSVPGQAPMQITLLAAHSCDAITRALEIACPNFDEVKPVGGIDIKVTPVRNQQDAEKCAA